MLKIVSLFVVIAAAFPVMAQDVSNQFQYNELLLRGNFKGLEEHLKAWKKAEPKNPELYVGYFNYYVRRNLTFKQELIQEGGRTFLANRPQYNEADVYTGIALLDKGIALAPQRIDMRWGKIELLMEIRDYKAASEAIIAVLEVSKKTKGRWLKRDTPVKNGEEYVLEYLIRFYGAMVDAASDASLSSLQKCGDVQIALYPKDVVGYNFAALACMLSMRADDALPYLLKAESLDGSDYLILLNLGRVYRMLSQKENAVKYFKQVIAKGDAMQRQAAQEMLNEM